MINSYTEYIERFMLPMGLKSLKAPGEHHFVATYLLPRLFNINQIVLDYINPDGTKEITGDIVYFKNSNHYLGIEVKFGTIHLTKNEFNSWVANKNASKYPEIFIGIGTAGIIILSWYDFREAYLASANITVPQPIERYGPQKSINTLLQEGKAKKEKGYLPKGCNESEAQEYENKFLQLLRKAITANKPLKPIATPQAAPA